MSGAVAERVKFVLFVIFLFILVALIYPVGGHWVWGGGWLSKMGFGDFAGSTVVHSIGGWAALAGVLVGPRIGKYGPDGGIGTVGALMFAMSACAWLLLKATIGIRVSKAEEVDGLDIGEHGMAAYAGLVGEEMSTEIA